MHKTLLLASAALVGALLVLPARAEDKAKEGTIFRSVDLIGKAVVNSKNEAIGRVEDYVVDMKDGHLVYVAVAHGDTLGFGGKLFAVSPRAIKLSDDWKTFVLNADKDDFEKGQGFDANKWPTAPDARWGAGKDEKPRKDEPATKSGEMHLRRLTSLMGLPVRNKDNESLGSVQGFGMDLNQERVTYLVLAHGGVVGLAAKYFAIPWESAELKSPGLRGDRVFVINASNSDFENSAGFDFKKWPNRADSRFTKDGTKKQ